MKTPLLLTIPLLFVWSIDALACEHRLTATVQVEEFIGDRSLSDLSEELIARGRKEALQQVAFSHVRVSSSERVDNENLDFKSTAKERYRGYVLSHTVLSRSTGKIGDRDTLQYELRVEVCAEPEDQVWYIVQNPFSSERNGKLHTLADVVASPSKQLQVVHSTDPGSNDATYILRGTVFSENFQINNWTNRLEQSRHTNCVEKAKQSSRMISGLLGAVTGRRLNLGDGGRHCGPRPPHRTGELLSLKAIFSTKICDNHMHTCKEHRQPHDHSQLVRSQDDVDNAKRTFYRDGFGLSSTISLTGLMAELGVKNAARPKPLASTSKSSNSSSRSGGIKIAHESPSAGDEP